MDTQAFVLGHILHRFPEFDFSMDAFNDRLRLQKFIYLLQAHDIYLGYDYSWYLRGPYCTALATDGFMLEEFYDMMPDGKQSKSEGFASSVMRERFKKFSNFVKDKLTNVDFLEVAASLHFLLSTGKATTYDDAVGQVLTKMERGYDYNETPPDKRIGEKYIRDVLQQLIMAGLIQEPQTFLANIVSPIRLLIDSTQHLKPTTPIDMPVGMSSRHTDKAFYCMVDDARMLGEQNVELVGVNVFRPDVRRPVPDDYVMNDGVVLDIRRKHGIGSPIRMGV